MSVPSTSHAPRRSVLLGAALALVATTYSNAIDGPFVWDDWVLICESRRDQTLEAARDYFTRPFWNGSASGDRHAAYYRPMAALSYGADWLRSEGDPAAFHVTNVLLHLLVCALLFVTALRLGAPSGAAIMAAALVGVLPRLTESVTWISGRTDVLAAAFSLGAIAVHSSERGRHLRRAAAAALLLGGLFSKEVAISALVAMVVLEIRRASPLRKNWRRVARNLVPASLAASLYALLRIAALAGAPAQEQIVLGAGGRVVAVLQALGAYLRMFADPLRPRLQIGLLGTADPLLFITGIVALAAIVLVAARTRSCGSPEVCAGLAFAACGLGLVLHVIPIGVQVIAADRFLYFPALGLGIAGAVASGMLAPRLRLAAAGLALVALPVLASATYLRNRDWSDEVRLWREAVRTAHVDAVLPRNELGNALFRRGHYEEALAEWEAVLPRTRGGDRVAILGNVASALSELGRYGEARELAISALAAEPDLPLHHYNLGVVEARMLRLDAAEATLVRAQQLLPGDVRNLRALEMVRAVRTELARLPAERDDEPMPLQVDRATIDERLGRRPEAERRWLRVIESGAPTPDQARHAAGFLLSRGSHEACERALHAFEARGLAGAGQLDELRAERARREAEGLLESPADRGGCRAGSPNPR